MKDSNNKLIKKSINFLSKEKNDKKKKLYIGGKKQRINLEEYVRDLGSKDISNIYEIDRAQESRIKEIKKILQNKGIKRKELINIEGEPETNVNDFYILDDEDEIIEILKKNPTHLKFLKNKMKLKKKLNKCINGHMMMMMIN